MNLNFAIFVTSAFIYFKKSLNFLWNWSLLGKSHYNFVYCPILIPHNQSHASEQLNSWDFLILEDTNYIFFSFFLGSLLIKHNTCLIILTYSFTNHSTKLSWENKRATKSAFWNHTSHHAPNLKDLFLPPKLWLICLCFNAVWQKTLK